MSVHLRPLVQVDRLGMIYGFRRIFENVSLHLKARERVALVGRNGVGKTTLLKILAGREEPTEGSIQWIAERPVVAYHPQEPDGDPDQPARLQMEQALSALGFASSGQIRELWRRAGLDDGALDRPFGQLSGGQKTRVSLLIRTLTQPDVLLLDEPTNHLDQDGLRWLEEFVLAFRGSLLVVSHDRAFLDRVAQRVLELRPDGVREYPGNYTDFRRAKEAALKRQEELYAAEQKRLRRLEEAIQRQVAWAEKSHREAGKKSDVRAAVPAERARAKKMARVAKARIRRLERMMERPVEKPRRDPTLRGLHFSGELHGRTLVMAAGLGKRFDRWLFQDANFTVDRGDKVGLIGPNGSGKTTLLKLLCGAESPSAGQLWTSPALRVGLLDQEVQRLDGHRTILDEAMAAIAVPTPDEITRVRTLLHAFLFRAEDLDKLVATLSTGERKRLALLKVTLAEVNLLVLDEPTDHLDIEAREKLEEVLESYEGTLIFTSHDRYFLQRVCTKILAIQRGTVVPYLGGYHYYEEKQQETGSASGRCGPGGTVSGPAAGLESGPPRTALSRDERLLIETRLAQLGAELARVPKEDPSYAQLEAEYLRLARRLNAGSR